jgi:hypothetical protein
VDNDDLDMGQVGGTLSWIAPSNVSAVMQYVVYLSEGEAGETRTELAAIGNLFNSSMIPPKTAVDNNTHFLVYTKSSLLEQTTPGTLLIYDDFLFVCDELPGISCGETSSPVSVAAGAGQCSPSNECNDCGLTSVRLGAVKKAITAGPMTILGAAADTGVHDAQAALSQCGLSATFTPYQARGMANPAVTGSPQFMCRYGCLANMTSCRMCIPYSDNSSDADTEPPADSDGLSVWRYLACRYRAIENAAGSDLKYAYVFSNGQFVGLGSELGSRVSCEDLATSAVSSEILPFDISNIECGPGPCKVTGGLIETAVIPESALTR